MEMNFWFFFFIAFVAIIIIVFMKKRVRNTNVTHYLQHKNPESTPDFPSEIIEYRTGLVNIKKVDSNENNQLKLNEINLPQSIIPIVQQSITSLNPIRNDVRKYKITFSKEVKEQLKKGSLTLMQNKNTGVIRPTAVDSKGKIIEQTKLVKKIDPKLLVGASFQLATIVVAQQHMQNIDKNLGELKGLVNQIVKQHYFEFKNHANVAIDYYQTHIIPSYNDNGLIEEKLQIKSEDIYFESLLNIGVLFDKQNECIENIKALKNSYFLGSVFKENDEVNKLTNLIDNYYEYQYIIDLYLHMFQLLYLPLQKIVLNEGKQISIIINKIQSIEIKSKEIDERLRSETELWANNLKVKIRLNSKSYIEKNRSKVINALDHISENNKAIGYEEIDVDKEIIIEIVGDKVQAYLN